MLRLQKNNLQKLRKIKGSIFLHLLPLFFLNPIPSFSVINPYYLNNNKAIFQITDNVFFLESSVLNILSFDLYYGINRNVLLYALLPYLFFNNFITDGVIGDVNLAIKFLLEKDFYEKWSLSFISIFQIPTGVIKEDSFRYVDGNRVSFYPFSKGVFSLTPGILFNYFLEPVMIWVSLFYCSENSREENILNFNNSYDRIEATLAFDYLFELKNFSLFYKPEISLKYVYNISDIKCVSDGLYLSLRNMVKIFNTLRVKFNFLLPVLPQDKLYGFSLEASFSVEF